MMALLMPSMNAFLAAPLESASSSAGLRWGVGGSLRSAYLMEPAIEGVTLVLSEFPSLSL